MNDKREIYRANGRYEMCTIVYWPHERKDPDYLVAIDENGNQIICHRAMGAWCEMRSLDIISRLRFFDEQAISGCSSVAER